MRPHCRISGRFASGRDLRHNADGRPFAVATGQSKEDGMRLLCAITLCLGFAATAAAQDAKVAKGKQLFADQKCTLCHSIGETGNKKGPLDGVASKISVEEIKSWITDPKAMTAKTKATRKPVMKQYTLAAEDVDALVAYLATLKK
jgi:cytochrome c2